ncbi:MAG: hypothetical protein KDA71_22545, partial [Planctomycetales bacterium]|nr:hypothetical protein [Planctomycetales bacterium]
DGIFYFGGKNESGQRADSTTNAPPVERDAQWTSDHTTQWKMCGDWLQIMRRRRPRRGKRRPQFSPASRIAGQIGRFGRGFQGL